MEHIKLSHKHTHTTHTPTHRSALTDRKTLPGVTPPQRSGVEQREVTQSGTAGLLRPD